MYKVYEAQLQGVSPYTQGKVIQSEKKPRETHEDFEARTWKERMHVDKNGYVFIPGIALKNCLSECAKFLSKQIPGKGKATYTKHFEAGLMVLENITLPIKADEIPPQKVHVPSDGKRGGTTRVWKNFPFIEQWEGTAQIIVFDEYITKDVLHEHLVDAGRFIGLGTYRPRNNGIHGRFDVVSLQEVSE